LGSTNAWTRRRRGVGHVVGDPGQAKQVRRAVEIARKAAATVLHVARRGPWTASNGVERLVDCRRRAVWEKKMVEEKFREAITATGFEFGKTDQAPILGGQAPSR
jgi:hypothetical protein